VEKKNSPENKRKKKQKAKKNKISDESTTKPAIVKEEKTSIKSEDNLE